MLKSSSTFIQHFFVAGKSLPACKHNFKGSVRYDVVPEIRSWKRQATHQVMRKPRAILPFTTDGVSSVTCYEQEEQKPAKLSTISSFETVIGAQAGVQQHHRDGLQSVVDAPRADMSNCYSCFFWASCRLCTFLYTPCCRSDAHPDLAVGVAKTDCRDFYGACFGHRSKRNTPPWARASLRRTTIPPFPTHCVRSAATLEHGAAETTHPASGSPSPDSLPTYDGLDCPTRDMSGLGGALFALGRHTAKRILPSSEVTRPKSHARSRSSPCLCCNRCIPARVSGAERRTGSGRGPASLQALLHAHRHRCAGWPLLIAPGPHSTPAAPGRARVESVSRASSTGSQPPPRSESNAVVSSPSSHSAGLSTPRLSRPQPCESLAFSAGRCAREREAPNGEARG